MFIFYSVKRNTRREPDVQFNCPACQTEGARAETYELSEQLKLFYLVPLVSLVNRWVHCDVCGAKLPCTCEIDALGSMSNDELQAVIRYGPSPAGKVWAVLALLLCLVPFVGVTIAGIATYAVRGTKGWPRSISLLALVVGGTVTGCVIAWIALT